MAKLKNGALAQSVTGSLGGLTFQKGRGQAIVRAKIAACKSRSPAQDFTRRNFAEARCLWHNLDTYERAEWNVAAPAPLNAWNWFLAVNLALAAQSQPMRRRPHAEPEPPPVFTATPDWTEVGWIIGASDQTNYISVLLEGGTPPYNFEPQNVGDTPFTATFDFETGQIAITAPDPMEVGEWWGSTRWTDSGEQEAFVEWCLIISEPE